MRAACSSFAHALGDRARRTRTGESPPGRRPRPARRARVRAGPSGVRPSRARGRGGRCAPAASVSSTRPCSARPAKQQFSERLSQPCSPAIHSASRSTQRRGSPARPTAIAGVGQLEQRRAGASSARPAAPARCTPGSTRPAVQRRERRLQAGACPSAPARTGTSFSSRACGAWSVATQSIVPARSPSISARRSASVASGGCIFMRVSMPRTSSSVSSRWCGRDLGADPPAARLGVRDRLDRGRAAEVLEVHARVLVARERGVARDHRRLGDVGMPPMPSAALTAPSCIAPPRESVGSSSCSAITPPHRRWYCSALRSIPGARAPACRRR